MLRKRIQEEQDEELPLTADELLALDEKYDDDPLLFMEDCLMIRPKEGGLIPFIPNEQQRRLVQEMERQRKAGLPVRVIILKARQIGFSTAVQAYFAWRLGRNRHLAALVLAHKSEASKNMFRMFVTYVEHMLADFKPNIKAKNEALGNLELGTDNPADMNDDPAFGSTLKIESAENQNAGRSGTYQLVHASEVAFWPYEDTFASLMATVGKMPGTVVVEESTANGATGQFYEEWKSAEAAQRKREAGLPLTAKDSQFVPIFVAWWQHDSYRLPVTQPEAEAWAKFKAALDEAVRTGGDHWKRHLAWVNDGELELDEDDIELARRYPVDYGQIKWYQSVLVNECKNDPDKRRQEFPSNPDEAFLASGRPFFDARQIIALKEEVEKEPKPRRFTIDEATSAQTGIPTITPDPFGELYVWKEPSTTAGYAIGADVAEGTENGDNSGAFVVDVQTNEHVATIWGKFDPDVYGQKLYWLGMWYNEALIGPEKNAQGAATVAALERMEYPNLWGPNWPWREKMTEHGWRTNVASRAPMLAHLKSAIREGSFKPHMVEFYDEAQTFKVNAKGKAEAERGKTDDLILSAALTLQMREFAAEQIGYVGYLGGVAVGGRSVSH